jgi:S-DNA-T family DNA segregation ATPase FtsK/SpoIIIE
MKITDGVRINMQKLEQQARKRNSRLHIKSGVKELTVHKWKIFFPLLYLLVMIVVWDKRNFVFDIIGGNLPSIFQMIFQYAVNIFMVLFTLVGLIFIVTIVGTPISAKRIQNNLMKIGLVNKIGECPLLLSKRKDRGNPNVTILEFDNCGISVGTWNEKQAQLEAALNYQIAQIEYGKSLQRIKLHVVPWQQFEHKVLHWNDKFLSNDEFVLVLGESLIGKETINLTNNPHILLGGSTGSGKSMLLKLLVMQCLKKNAIVHICDFKGGVDFSPSWHEKCQIVTSTGDLINMLTNVVDILEDRKELFVKSICKNLDEYNKSANPPLPRIIVACDEIAEVLDKTGLGKSDKESVQKIESLLSTIARLGRAFGIHLILATQRPDAIVLPGQIKNNIIFRVCGKSDKILSQIILDNTDAADSISKDSQGQFLTNSGVLFQGYFYEG